MNDGISQLSIQALLNGGDSYVIPIYQRNYNWDEGEIHQLIQDVRDSRPQEKNYYLGTLVVDQRSEGKIFETIDGQQRLTTLALLACYLKNENLAGWYEKTNLRFDSRETSSHTFEEQDEFGAGKNRRILMLMAAFHVSAPAMTSKYWLYAALKYLFNLRKTPVEGHVSTEGHVSPEDYLDYLENTAKAFMFDRYLSNKGGLDYFAIIERNQGMCQQPPKDSAGDWLKPYLSYNNIGNIFVFNYLDYLLWLKHLEEEKVKYFDFTFRSSVEHYYPQTPETGDKSWDDKVLNSFGNLCLISHSRNSLLSNRSPVAKKDYYEKNRIDSIKQFLMMEKNTWNENSAKNTWNENSAIEHENEMIKVIMEGPKKN